jgi:protocatechuate 3,4-dioxygenase beta subunit
MKTIAVVASLLIVSDFCLSQESAPFPQPAEGVSSVATFVAEGEPGERLLITGKVYRSDKTTPYSGLVLYFYQTDATGVYNKTDGSYRRPRLYGWAKTDKDGAYELRTIKPGSYPRSRVPAHIHVTMKNAGTSARWLDSFLFEGDPNLSESEIRQMQTEGRFSPVVKLSKGKTGELRAVRDIVIPS